MLPSAVVELCLIDSRNGTPWQTVGVHPTHVLTAIKPFWETSIYLDVLCHPPAWVHAPVHRADLARMRQASLPHGNDGAVGARTPSHQVWVRHQLRHVPENNCSVGWTP